MKSGKTIYSKNDDLIQSSKVEKVVMQTRIKINLRYFLVILYMFGIVYFSDGDAALKIIRTVFVLGSLIVMLLQSKIIIKNDFYVMWAVSFLILCIASIQWALSSSLAASMSITVGLNIICLFILYWHISVDTSVINIVIWCLIIFPIVLSIKVFGTYGILAFFNTRYVSNVMSSNAIGVRTAIGFGFSLFWLFEYRNGKKIISKNQRIILSFCMLLNSLFVVLTASRKALFIMFAPVLLYSVLKSKNPLKLFKNLVIAFITFLIVYFIIINVDFLYLIIGNRFESLLGIFSSDQITDGSTSFRLAMISMGIEWFKLKPLLGYGLDNYRALLGQVDTNFGSAGTYAHNNYIEIAVSLGIVGLITYYSFYISIIRSFFRNRKKNNDLQIYAFCCLVVIIITEFGLVTYYDKFVTMLILLIWLIVTDHKQNTLNNERFYSNNS